MQCRDCIFLIKKFFSNHGQSKKIIDFDMIAIMDEQKPKKEKYEHKKREMFLYK